MKNQGFDKKQISTKIKINKWVTKMKFYLKKYIFSYKILKIKFLSIFSLIYLNFYSKHNVIDKKIMKLLNKTKKCINKKR